MSRKESGFCLPAVCLVFFPLVILNLFQDPRRKGKSKEGRVKREGGIAWLSHFTEMTAVIRYPCDCEPFTEHEHFGFSRDVRNGKR